MSEARRGWLFFVVKWGIRTLGLSIIVSLLHLIVLHRSNCFDTPIPIVCSIEDFNGLRDWVEE